MKYNPINWENSPSNKTPITAENLRHMDNQIAKNTEDIEKLNERKVTSLVGTLSAGQTTLVFTNENFTDDSNVTFYSKPYGHYPLSVTEDLVNNRITTTWRTQPFDISVKLELTNG